MSKGKLVKKTGRKVIGRGRLKKKVVPKRTAPKKSRMSRYV